MRHAVARKKRNHSAIKKSSQKFSDLIKKRDYKSAGYLVFQCALEVGGTQGIMCALDDANSFLNRKRLLM